MTRVLVIDDDAGTLFGYKHVLRGAGHEFVTAALGEDGTRLPSVMFLTSCEATTDHAHGTELDRCGARAIAAVAFALTRRLT